MLVVVDRGSRAPPTFLRDCARHCPATDKLARLPVAQANHLAQVKELPLVAQGRGVAPRQWFALVVFVSAFTRIRKTHIDPSQ